MLAAALAVAVPAAAAAKPTDAEISAFLKMDVGSMTPELIRFMLALPETDVPEKLRKKFKAKRLELHTYKQLGGKSRGGMIFPEKDCSIPSESKSEEIAVLQSVGYVEAFEHEIQYLHEKTHCSERQMMCEFSLQIILEKRKGGKQSVRRLFLHGKDPLMALISEFRVKGANRDTPFFGRSTFPTCGQ